MKNSFAAKTFASRTFRSGNWTGLGVDVSSVIGYTIERAQVFVPGAKAASAFNPGPKAGQAFIPGPKAAQVIT